MRKYVMMYLSHINWIWASRSVKKNIDPLFLIQPFDGFYISFFYIFVQYSYSTYFISTFKGYF